MNDLNIEKVPFIFKNKFDRHVEFPFKFIDGQNLFFFFNFFTTKSPNFISNLNDDCSQLSFEVYNVCVAQKLQISEFLIDFFAWTLATPGTS